MNWPLLVRKLCQAYEGTTPRDFENLSRDQLYVMMLPEETLRSLSSVRVMSTNAAISKGFVPNDRHLLDGYRSLAEKLNAEEAARNKKTKSELRDARRKLRLQATEQADKIGDSD